MKQTPTGQITLYPVAARLLDREQRAAIQPGEHDLDRTSTDQGQRLIGPLGTADVAAVQ